MGCDFGFIRTYRFSWLTSISGSGCQNTQTDDGWHSWDSLSIFLSLRGLSTTLPSLVAGGYLDGLLICRIRAPKECVEGASHVDALPIMNSPHKSYSIISTKEMIGTVTKPCQFPQVWDIDTICQLEDHQKHCRKNNGMKYTYSCTLFEHTIYPMVYTSVNFSGHVSGHPEIYSQITL